MLQDLVQVDLLGAGVRKQCVLPFVHAPPPPLVVPPPPPPTPPPFPTPARTPSPFSCTWEHTGSLSLIFAPSPPLARSTLRLGCTSPCSHTLRASAICFPGCTAHRSVPLPFTHGPLACGPPLTRGPFVCRPLACGPPLTRGPFTHGPLACGPPLTHGPLCMALPLRAHLSLLRFQYARKRGGGGAGGRGAAGVGGTARARGGGRHRPLCLPSMCAKGEAGGRGEVHCKLGGRDGEARVEGRTEGGGAHCPSCPSPCIHTKGGGGCVWG